MKKNGILITAAALFLVIVGAGFAYNKWKDEAGAQTLVGETENQEEVTENQEEVTENQEEKEETAEEVKRQEAIDVKIYDSEGNPVQLSQFYGKPIVMNFWATWCGYCKEEMPDFQEAWKEYGEEVEFLFINSTDGVRETREKASSYLEEQKLEIPAYYDEDMEAAYAYTVNSLPTTILIDKEGRVSAYAPGLIQKEMLVQALDALLAE